MQNVIEMPTLENNPATNKAILIVSMFGFVVFALLMSFDTTAGSGGSAFNSIWTEISGWADGVPGKIITLLAFGASLFNVLNQNYYLAIGAFIGGMLLSQSVTIINVFLTGIII